MEDEHFIVHRIVHSDHLHLPASTIEANRNILWWPRSDPNLTFQSVLPRLENRLFGELRMPPQDAFVYGYLLRLSSRSQVLSYKLYYVFTASKASHYCRERFVELVSRERHRLLRRLAAS